MKYATFETLTVGQFQELYLINKSDSEDKDVRSVSVLTGLTENAIEDLPYVKYNEICREIVNIFSRFDLTKAKRPNSYIKIGGKRFGIIYDPATISTGQYVSIQTWMQENVIDNLNRIMASLVYPVKGIFPFWRRGKLNESDHPAIAEQIKDCNFMQVHAACVFFLTLYKNSINSLRGYLAMAAAQKGVEPQKIHQLLKNITDGYITPNGQQTLKT